MNGLKDEMKVSDGSRHGDVHGIDGLPIFTPWLLKILPNSWHICSVASSPLEAMDDFENRNITMKGVG